jgi:hypothetical protein
MVTISPNKNLADFLIKNAFYVIICLFLIATYIVYIVVFSIGENDIFNKHVTVTLSNSVHGFCLAIAIISLVFVTGFIGKRVLDYYFKN